MKKLLCLIIPAIAVMAACSHEVTDEPINAYSFKAVAETVEEGNDIPVHLYFSDGGLVVDNPSWGDKWKNATFYAELVDSYGRKVDNAVFCGPEGVLGNGSTIDLNPEGKTDIIIASLREGVYQLKINLQTRYTVDTWASTSINVLPGSGQGGEVIYVDDIIVPGKDNGLEIDDVGNIILDLRIFNETNPFRFMVGVRPEDATNKKVHAEPVDGTESGASVSGDALLILTPKKVGITKVNLRSDDGHATNSFGLKVIETLPDADGFTLPTDDSEKDGYDFDVAGRLALDINEWNESNPFDYTCNPVPSTAAKPDLMAESDTPSVLVATIKDGNRLILTPKSPGYATVTVSTTDGLIVRKMKVAVISRFNLIVDAEESEASDVDKQFGIFPCRLTFKASSSWTPQRLRTEVFSKVTGRVDLTDPADYFLVDSLKNSRTAYYTYEEKIPVLYMSSGNSAYLLYERVFKKLASASVMVHHSDDWPRYYDYTTYFKLYKAILNVSVIEEFDTNIYRVSLVRKYDSPEHKLYQYLR